MSFLTFFYVEFKEVRGVKTARRQIGICCKIQDKYLLKETIKKCLQILLKINAVSEWSRTWHLYTYFGPGSRKQVTCIILHCDVVKASGASRNSRWWEITTPPLSLSISLLLSPFLCMVIAQLYNYSFWASEQVGLLFKFRILCFQLLSCMCFCSHKMIKIIEFYILFIYFI